MFRRVAQTTNHFFEYLWPCQTQTIRYTMYTSCQVRLVTLETLYDSANGLKRASRNQMVSDSVPEQESHNALSHTKTHVALGKHRRLPSQASFEVEDGFRIFYIDTRVERIQLVYLPQYVCTPARDLRLSTCSNAFTTHSTCTPHHQARGNFATNSYSRVTSNCIPSGSISEKTQHLAGLIPHFPIRHSRSTHTLFLLSLSPGAPR
jgi:hypothetical protein